MNTIQKDTTKNYDETSKKKTTNDEKQNNAHKINELNCR